MFWALLSLWLLSIVKNRGKSVFVRWSDFYLGSWRSKRTWVCLPLSNYSVHRSTFLFSRSFPDLGFQMEGKYISCCGPFLRIMKCGLIEGKDDGAMAKSILEGFPPTFLSFLFFTTNNQIHHHYHTMYPFIRIFTLPASRFWQRNRQGVMDGLVGTGVALAGASVYLTHFKKPVPE